MLKDTVLIVVNLQFDLCHPFGSFYVPGGEEIVPLFPLWLNSLTKEKPPILDYKTVIGIVDIHSPKHYSFKENGGEYPRNCVQGTLGVIIPREVERTFATTLYKGKNPRNRNDQSGFAGKTECGKNLPQILEEIGVRKVHIAGLALEYNVKATALDAIKLGYRTSIMLQLTRSIPTNASIAALAELKTEGVNLIA